MTARIVKLGGFASSAVNFYSFQFEDSHISEFQDFFDRWKKIIQSSPNDFNRYKRDINKIRAYLNNLKSRTEIGSHLLKDEALKDTNSTAIAIPTHYDHRKKGSSAGFGLRLYGFQVSPQIIVWGNGNNKSEVDARNCANVRKFFYDANYMSMVTQEAISSRKLIVFKNEILHINKHSLKFEV